MPKGIQGFQKGNKINLGKHWKIKDTSKMKDKRRSILTEFKKGNIPWNKGSHIYCGGGFKKGCTPWNNGKKGKNSWKYPHPFTKEHKEKLSLAKIGKMPKSCFEKGYSPYGNTTRGWFDINGRKMFFRSKWEVNYALYLDWLVKQNEIQKWEYEVDVFIFEKIKFGTRSYKPDFKIFNNNGTIEYHEIKGWMDNRSKTKIKRMRIYYPKIKLIVIEKVGYNDLVKKVGRLCGFI